MRLYSSMYHVLLSGIAATGGGGKRHTPNETPATRERGGGQWKTSISDNLRRFHVKNICKHRSESINMPSPLFGAGVSSRRDYIQVSSTGDGMGWDGISCA